MQNNIFQSVVVALIVVLLVSLSDPFMVLMPAPLAMTALLVATVLISLFAGFVLMEQAGDEREALHRLEAGRVAYLLGVGTLTLGVLVQGFTTHEIDLWLALALGVMIVAKFFAHRYAERRH